MERSQKIKSPSSGRCAPDRSGNQILLVMQFHSLEFQISKKRWATRSGVFPFEHNPIKFIKQKIFDFPEITNCSLKSPE
jgi:hypothetical protein